MDLGSMGIGQDLLESAWGVNGLLVFDGRALPIHTLYPVLVTDVRRWVTWHLQRFRELSEVHSSAESSSEGSGSANERRNERLISPELNDRVRRSVNFGDPRSGSVIHHLRVDRSPLAQWLQEMRSEFAFEQELEAYLAGETPITPTLPHLEWRERLGLDQVIRGELDLYGEVVLHNAKRATTDSLPVFILNLDSEVPYVWVTQTIGSVIHGASRDFEARLVSNNELFERIALEIERHPEQNEEDAIFEELDTPGDGEGPVSSEFTGGVEVPTGPDPFVWEARKNSPRLANTTSLAAPSLRRLRFSSQIV